jgi:predicted RNase H-like nuclease (RuvC/YqgF family)
MPRPGSDSDSDSDDDAGDMVRDGDPSRSTASSSASLVDPSERVAALQRVNADLARKLADTERAMQRKLAEQESEFEELQGRLEETRNELTAAKREEKELRGKEVLRLSSFLILIR